MLRLQLLELDVYGLDKEGRTVMIRRCGRRWARCRGLERTEGAARVPVSRWFGGGQGSCLAASCCHPTLSRRPLYVDVPRPGAAAQAEGNGGGDGGVAEQPFWGAAAPVPQAAVLPAFAASSLEAKALLSNVPPGKQLA